MSVLTFLRRETRRDDARAVRNAVTSSALTNPNGLPSEVIRFSTPWGVVPMLSFEGALSRSGGGGRSSEGVASVTTICLWVVAQTAGGCRKDGIPFIPILVADKAGIKSVVVPFGDSITVLFG